MAARDLGVDERTGAFYRDVLRRLHGAGVPFLIGGAYALEYYTAVTRPVKDIDVFTRSADRNRALAALARVGYETEVTSPTWLGKVRQGEEFVDLISSSGNAIAEVDDEWFAHAEPGTVLGVPIDFCPPEETIWSKSYVMERERYDGADVLHLVRARGARMNWERLLRRFGPHWRVLLSHLVLFGFVYPNEQRAVPDEVMRELLGRLVAELTQPPAASPLCQGTLLSKSQYRIDIERWGYHDGRLKPFGKMTRRQATAIDRESKSASHCKTYRSL